MIGHRKVRTLGLGIALVATAVVGISALSAKPARADSNLLAATLNIMSQVEAQGYSCRVGAHAVYLDPGYYLHVKTTLYRGNVYRIVGIGDSGAGTLDVSVYDGNGDSITEAIGEVPSANVVITHTGNASYDVLMRSGAGMVIALVCYAD
jgi:hypothetical protein